MPFSYDKFDQIVDSDDEKEVAQIPLEPHYGVHYATDLELCTAAMNGDVETLLRAGPARCGECRTTGGRDLVHVTTVNEQDKCLSLLLCVFDLNPNSKDPEGYTALFMASAGSKVAAVRTLLLNRADPNIVSENTDLGPLHVGVNADVARLLLKAKADPTQPAAGLLPLHTALQNASPETVKCLTYSMPAHEMPSPRFGSSETFLSFAMRKGCPDANIDMLLGLIVNANLFKTCDLHMAARHGYVRHLPLMVRVVGSVDALDEEGSTPLHTACWGKNLKAFAVVKKLVALGADINTVSRSGCTALLFSLWNPRIAKWLLHRGVDIKPISGVTKHMIEGMQEEFPREVNREEFLTVVGMIEYMEKRTCPVCKAFARRFCERCRSVFYCNQQCQMQDFNAHRPHCNSEIEG
jgi:hypothetical protein